jgi:hypothetical protein
MGQRVSREVVAVAPPVPPVEVDMGFACVIKGGKTTPLLNEPCIQRLLEWDAIFSFEARQAACMADVDRATAKVKAAERTLDGFARRSADVAAALRARTALDEAKARLKSAVEAQAATYIEHIVAAAKEVVLVFAAMAVAHGCSSVTVLVVVPGSVTIPDLYRAWHAQTLAPDVLAGDVSGSLLLWGGSDSVIDGSRTMALTAFINRGDGGELVVWDRGTSEHLMGEAFIAKHRRRVGLK